MEGDEEMMKANQEMIRRAQERLPLPPRTPAFARETVRPARPS